MIKNISAKNAPSLDNICYLISTTKKQDKIGQWLDDETTEDFVWCAELSASSTEFYKAFAVGIKPETVLVLDTESYGGQKKVKYNNAIFSVYRIYPRPDGFVELYLQVKAGD